MRDGWKIQSGGASGWAWLTLLLALSLTAYGYVLARESAERQLRTRFEFQVREVQEAVRDRMVAYRQVLRGAAAFVDAAGPVSRREWQDYVRRLHIDENYAGIQGIGYAEFVTEDELPTHQARIRAQGFPDYSVWPAGERPFYGAIVYLEPFDWRNRRAFGYDMLSEQTRRQAMLRAAETGSSVLSGKVTLVQETESDVQSGALLYLPVYRGGAAPSSPEARREALAGWVYSPFRMTDLMRGILGQSVTDLQLAIFDGEDSRPEDLMLRIPENGIDGALSSTTQIHFADRTWTLRVSSLPGFHVEMKREPLVVLVLGVLVSLLLFAIVRNLSTTRSRALALARQMTAALRQSEERFRVALKNSNITVFNQDRDLHLTWVFNPRHGWAQQAAPKSTDYEVPAQKAAIPLKRRVLEEGVSVHREIETELDGRRLVYDLTLEPLREGDQIVGLTGAAVDVTAHKQVQDELRESEARFRTTFETAAIGIVLSDRNDRILATNPAFREMVGCAEEDCGGQLFTEFVQGADRIEGDHLLEQLRLSDKAYIKRDERYRSADGSEIVVRLTFSMIPDVDARPKYLLRLVEDVTELRAAEEALRAAYAELERRVEQRTAELRRRTEELSRSNAELAQFAYVASHDLQEPLRTVGSFSQLLERRYAGVLDAEGREFLGHIVDGTNRMRALIRDLLTFSQVGAGESGVRPVAMDAVLAVVLRNLDAAAREAGAVITSDALPEVMGYEHDLVQLFQNLLANAIKFRGARTPRIHVGVEEQDGSWCFSVSDNGIGIPEQELEQVFTIFRRIHPRERYPGTGIGLAICKKVVERHGGQVWVRSAAGQGSTFFFSLPK